ncbi:hypothetical protein C6P12_08360 [Weissella confusa]|uniref:hypothetical protein n=1 Tax=Weissella confusa TaxID=1583 RepID=UPI00107F1EFC|nr:hypothetical protein [Weissella confusa]TGE64070.1 hypothetical protein C6P12_08360 [Weissella confusa]
MTKYVIDLPEGVKFIVGKGYVMCSEKELLRIPVESLQEYIAPTVAEDAPVEKRVIELPADSIAWLERMKSNLETVDVYDLFNNVLADTSGSYVSYQLNFNSETAALNTVAEWVLGHVEFVPKKGPKFYIRVFDVFDADGNDLYLASMGNNKFRMTIYTDSAGMFTEKEADKIIADVSNLDVSLTARKVKVDE